MRSFFILFLFAFLPACTVYTVTNSTNRSLEIEKAGGGILTLKALKCVELNEYFLGLGGDFPFIIKGQDKEYGAGNYIIELKNSKKNGDSDIQAGDEKTGEYEANLSEKNLACEPEESEKSKDVKGGGGKPKCNDGKDATCYESAVKCVGDGNDKKAVCVDEDDKTIDSVKAECKDQSKPSCPTKGGFFVDDERKPLCVTGTASCEDGELKCVKENKVSTPLCLKDGEKVENVSVSCGDSKGGVKCLKSIELQVKTQYRVSCGNGKSPSCADGSRAVCGSLSTDEDTRPYRPYCVNDKNIRWSDVDCSGGNATCTSESRRT